MIVHAIGMRPPEQPISEDMSLFLESTYLITAKARPLRRCRPGWWADAGEDRLGRSGRSGEALDSEAK